ncbi:hypothetical protein ACFX11_047308 [Malus domestica]
MVIYEKHNYLCVPSGHSAAWGEDLVLADKLGEIIPSYRLRDTEQALGRELVISGYRRRNHGAGIWWGDILLFNDLTSSTPRLRDNLRDDTRDDLYDVFPRYTC